MDDMMGIGAGMLIWGIVDSADRAACRAHRQTVEELTAKSWLRRQNHAPVSTQGMLVMKSQMKSLTKQLRILLKKSCALYRACRVHVYEAQGTRAAAYEGCRPLVTLCQEAVYPMPHLGRNLIGAKTKLFYPGTHNHHLPLNAILWAVP